MKKKKILIIISLIVFVIILVFLQLNSKEIKSIAKTNPFVKKLFVDSGEEIIGTWDISSTESDSVVANLYGDGRLVISGTGKMKSWTNEDNDDWHNKEISILVKQIIVENGITLIGRNAFINCENLLSIEISESIERIGSDGVDIVANGQDLEKIKDKNNIVYGVFSGCSKLENINIKTNNDNYSSIDGVLFNKNQTEIECYPAGKNEKTYVIPNTVTIIRTNAFKDANNLNTIEIAEGMETINAYAFNGCVGINIIDIPSSVKGIGDYAFNNCSNLEKINIDNNNTIYRSIDGVLFNKYGKLICYPQGKKDKKYEIPDGIITIGTLAFANCNHLENVKLPETSLDVTIETAAFYYCSALKSVEITKNVTNIENYAKTIMLNNVIKMASFSTFYNCSNLDTIIVDEENQNYSSKNGVLFNNDKTILVFYPEGKLEDTYIIPESVTSIEEKSFLNCKNLKKLVIPNSITDLTNFELTSDEENHPYIIEKIGKSEKLDVTIICKKDSAAEQYAIDKEFDYEIDDDAPEISFSESLENVTKNDIVLTIKDDKAGLRSVIINEQELSLENKQAEYTISKNGKYTITAIDNLGNTLTQDINISNIDKELPTATISTDKEKYYEGETATITAIFNEDVKNGTPKISISGAAKLDKTDMVKSDSKKYTYSYIVPKATGKQTITISDAEDLAGNVMENNNTIKFDIEQITLESIKITAEPTKKTYKAGENFDKTGMKVTATYNNKTSKEITNYTITDGENLTLDKTSVTITYTENGITKTITQAITVIENQSINFSTYAEINKDGKDYLTKIESSTTIGQFRNNIETPVTIKIFKNNQEVTNNNEKIVTGMKAKLELNNETFEYVLVVKGDANGDGIAEIKDLLMLNKHRLKKILLENEYFLAGDVNNDNNIDIRDLLQLNKFRLGKITSL